MAIVPAPVPDFSSRVNISAVKSGTASDPTVWNLNRPLQDGDFIGIAAGITIVWDLLTSPRLAGIYYQGTLDTGSAPGDKQMTLATLFCDGGDYKCGSCISNTPLNGTFTLTFTDTAPDPAFDPGQFGTGFLTMGGTVDICGSANKTSWAYAQGAAKSSTQITLALVPQEWNAGDQVLVPATVYANPRQDEVIKLASINGNVITLASPLVYDHSVPILSFTPASWTTNGTVNVSISYSLTADTQNQSVTVASTYVWKDLASGQGDTYTNSWTYNNAILFNGNQVSPLFAVGNLTRNVVFQSANPNGTRGHVMFMRDMNGKPTMVSACHVLVKDCGRTLATQVVTDPMVDTSFTPPQLVAGTAANPRARYAWHSHRQGQGTGYGDTSALQIWDGIVVWGAEKWCYDNHDSNVKCTNCIAYDFDGAGFATERGSEIGEYTNCFAVGGDGIGTNQTFQSGQLFITRNNAEDAGWEGTGIWLQGPGVSVNGCVVSGGISGGVYWSPMGPQGQTAIGVLAKRYPWANLSAADQAYWTKAGFNSALPPLVGAIPPQVGNTAGNLAFACGSGGFIGWEGDGMRGDNKGQFTDCSVFNCPSGLIQQYLSNFGYVNPVCIGPYVAGAKAMTGVNGFSALNVNVGYGSSQFIDNPALIGWDTGSANTLMANLFAGGYFANITDFYIPLATLGLGVSNENVTSMQQWSGNPIFAPLQQPVPAGKTRLNFFFDPPNPAPTQYLTTWFDANLLFHTQLYQLPHNWQLYFSNSADNAVPFPVGGNYYKDFPQQLLGTTNAQIVAALSEGLWGFGAVGSVPCPWTSNGIIGTQMNLGSYSIFSYPRFTMLSPVQPTTGTGYVLKVLDFRGGGNAQPVVFPAVDLVPGWNFFTQSIDGFNWVFAVYGPATSPPPPAVPATPTGLTAHCNRVVLNWSPAANATSFNLRRSPDGMAWTSLATGLTMPMYTDSTVMPGTFFYEVQASNTAGVSPWSAAAQITVP